MWEISCWSCKRKKCYLFNGIWRSTIINIGTNWLKNNGSLKKEIFIFGGMDIYNLGLVYCDYIYLTEVDMYPDSKYVFPKIDPINKLFELLKLKLFVKKSLKFEKKVIKATAKITPGIAYPDIEKVVR